MRSFLIRDILSGPGSGAASGGADAGATAAAAAAAAVAATAAAAGADQHQAVSAGSFESLAATQARFLAKLAEHQQQVQASKYYEQLQQQHHQLINLNLNHHQHQHHHHHHQLQLQQQIQQHQQLTHHQHQHQQQQLLLNQSVSSSIKNSSASSKSSIPAESSLTCATNKKPQKTSSFAYDCTSPISSISDVERADEDDDDDDDENNDDDDARDGGADDEDATADLGKGDRYNQDDDEDDDDDDDNDDDEDDEDEEIEVEKLPGTEESSARRKRSQHRHRRRQHRHRQQHLGGDDADSGEFGTTANNSATGNRMMGAQANHQQQQQQQLLGKQQLPAQFQMNSPLDALFQMTSSTFDALKRGEKRKDREAEHHSSANFTNKQASKKKRKSRTAFTNNQIYELERRFRMQKYLSPTDRDEIALTLNLSNAQVITWFQNRRAKLKRDLEEQKRDIETASLLNLHKTFLESFQALSQMKTAIKTNESMCRPGETNIHEHEQEQLNQLS